MSFKFSHIDGLPSLVRPDWYVKFITTEYRGSNGELGFDYTKSIFTTITFTINLGALCVSSTELTRSNGNVGAGSCVASNELSGFMLRSGFIAPINTAE